MSKTIKGKQLIEYMLRGVLKEGTKIQCTDGWDGIYEFHNGKFDKIDSNAIILNRYSLDSFLATYFRILEDEEIIDIDDIEELNEFIHIGDNVEPSIVDDRNVTINKLIRYLKQTKKAE